MGAAVACVLAVLTGGAVAAVAAQDAAPRFNTTRDNVVAKGYDVVAYFTAQKPVKGDAAYAYTWQGVVWHFSSAANRDLFAKSPEKYAPEFGGFCSWAVSRNYTADIDPEAWTIVDGRLYLNYSLRVQRTWLEDRDGNIAKARANWPALSRKK